MDSLFAQIWGHVNRLVSNRLVFFGILGLIGWADIRTGNNGYVVRLYAKWLRHNGLPYYSAIWVVTACKLGLMVLGARLFGFALHGLGTFAGGGGSSGRMQHQATAIFLVVMLARSLPAMSYRTPMLRTLSVLLYGVSLILLFSAIYEQYSKEMIRVVVVFVGVLFLAKGIWNSGEKFVSSGSLLAYKSVSKITSVSKHHYKYRNSHRRRRHR